MKTVVLALIALAVVVGIIVVSSYPRWSKGDGDRLMETLRAQVGHKQFKDALETLEGLRNPRLRFPKSQKPSSRDMNQLRKKLMKKVHKKVDHYL